MSNNEWYVKKRGEMYRAYQAALEMEELDEAERLFKEYETYAKLSAPQPEQGDSKTDKVNRPFLRSVGGAS